VIHHLDYDTSLLQAKIAFQSHADGVFLISHEGADGELLTPALDIKKSYPSKSIGLNFLTLSPSEALQKVADHNLDMVWVDNPGISSAKTSNEALKIGEWLTHNGGKVRFFASVAFKYQAVDPNPGAAASAAAGLHMIPTTSGNATGYSPSVEKIRSMRETLGPQAPLAIASGVSPENVHDYLPYATHFLVATGVSKDEHHFDPDLASALEKRIHDY
jgi:hypothetical protein